MFTNRKNIEEASFVNGIIQVPIVDVKEQPCRLFVELECNTK